MTHSSYTIAKEFEHCWFLREIDLHPEPLAKYPHHMHKDWCEGFLKQGLLFKTREEAEAARDAMISAYNSFRTSSVSSSQEQTLLSSFIFL